MVRVQCPHCERRYRTKIEAFGRVAVCTRCNAAFKIGDSRPPFEWKSSSLAEDSWIGVEAPPEPEERKHCIICDAPLRPGQVSCPECRANQVTGVVNRPKPKGEVFERSIGNVLPIRTILIFALLAGIACIGYLAILAIGASAKKVSDELAEGVTMNRAVAMFRKDGSEAVRREFAGEVTSENLRPYVGRLSARDPDFRDTAAHMIAVANVQDLTPLAEWVAKQERREEAASVLRTIGVRKFVESSSVGEEAARESAARLMLAACGLQPTPEMVKSLSEKTAPDQKASRFTDMCRAWPEAIGVFELVVNDKPAPFRVSVDQVGCMFYLKINGSELASSGGGRQFDIPLETWCAATGSAVDARKAREVLSGRVQLSSPHGVGWAGSIEGQLLQEAVTLPGYLPIDPPQRGARFTAIVQLRRPGK